MKHYIYVLKGKQISPGKALDYTLSGKGMFKPIFELPDVAEFLADEYFLSQKMLAHANVGLKTLEDLNAPKPLLEGQKRMVQRWQFRALVAEPYQRSRQSVLQ